MKFKSRFPVTLCAALSTLLLLFAAPPRSAAAALIPGTPLDGTNDGFAVVATDTTAIEGGNPYNNFADLTGADRAVPGDVVILTHVTGNAAIDDEPSNWAAVARFFSPSDLDGSKGTDATEEIGFLATDAPLEPATDFSTFTLFPNVFYAPATATLGDVVNSLITEFGPAGVILPNQSAIIQVIVDGVPEPATAALLAIAAPLLLSRRRRARFILIANQMD